MMVQLLLLNREKNLEDLSSKIFKSLELGNVPPLDSLHVCKGEYFAQRFLGIEIRLEYKIGIFSKRTMKCSSEF